MLADRCVRRVSMQRRSERTWDSPQVPYHWIRGHVSDRLGSILILLSGRHSALYPTPTTHSLYTQSASPGVVNIMTQNPGAKSPGGVLQISAAATQKNAPTAPRKAPKPAAPRLKLLVRRLPPGLTQTEFETVLGPEWKTGAGKVDWLQYKPGKVSKE